MRIRWPWWFEDILVRRSRRRGPIGAVCTKRSRRGRHTWNRRWLSWRETPRWARKLYGNRHPYPKRRLW